MHEPSAAPGSAPFVLQGCGSDGLLSGHLDFDLDAARLVESVLTLRTTRSMPDGGTVRHDYETRTEWVNEAR